MQSQSEPQGHVAVLLHEAVNGLNLAQGGTFVDCTLGNAGHTLEIFKRFGNDIDYIGLDADPERLAYAKTLLSDAGCSAKLFNENFRDLDSALREAGVERASAILFDLGLNSEQLESSGRGFSFKHNEPLLMTFGKPQAGDLTAREIVNRYDEESLERILREYGEERQARSIARAIVTKRKQKPLETTFDLIEAVRKGYRGKYPRSIHFATRTFQALRMEINDEVGALREALEKAFQALLGKGRIAVISFHSIEDRIVKQFNKKQAEAGRAYLVNKKPIVPQENELEMNPRARSAKLRILERI